MRDERILAEIHKMRQDVTEVVTLVSLFVPSSLSVSKLADALGKDTGTIRVHLEGNFIKGVDYFQEVNRGKITIPLKTAFSVAKYYKQKEGAKDV